MEEEDISAGPYTVDSVFDLDNALYRIRLFPSMPPFSMRRRRMDSGWSVVFRSWRNKYVVGFNRDGKRSSARVPDDLRPSLPSSTLVCQGLNGCQCIVTHYSLGASQRREDGPDSVTYPVPSAALATISLHRDNLCVLLYGRCLSLNQRKRLERNLFKVEDIIMVDIVTPFGTDDSHSAKRIFHNTETNVVYRGGCRFCKPFGRASS